MSDMFMWGSYSEIRARMSESEKSQCSRSRREVPKGIWGHVGIATGSSGVGRGGFGGWSWSLFFFSCLYRFFFWFNFFFLSINLLLADSDGYCEGVIRDS